MPVSMQELMVMDPDELFDGEVDNLKAGSNNLGIIIGTKCSKSRKVNKLNSAIVQAKF